MSDFRMKRVNEQVKRELSSLIRQELPVDHYGLISVTEVDVSKDLKTATVFVSAIGQKGKVDDVIPQLEKVRRALQHGLSQKIVMKYTPHLLFKLDHGLERGQHIMDLLEGLDGGQKT